MHGQQFTPYYGQTVSVASAAGAVAVSVASRARALLLTNVGTQLVFVRVRAPGATTNASATDLPLPAGSQRVVLKGADPMGGTDGETSVSIFGTAAGSTIYVTPGEVPGT
jgi:hypothetical protein